MYSRLVRWRRRAYFHSISTQPIELKFSSIHNFWAVEVFLWMSTSFRLSFSMFFYIVSTVGVHSLAIFYRIWTMRKSVRTFLKACYFHNCNWFLSLKFLHLCHCMQTFQMLWDMAYVEFINFSNNNVSSDNISCQKFTFPTTHKLGLY